MINMKTLWKLQVKGTFGTQNNGALRALRNDNYSPKRYLRACIFFTPHFKHEQGKRPQVEQIIATADSKSVCYSAKELTRGL